MSDLGARALVAFRREPYHISVVEIHLSYTLDLIGHSSVESLHLDTLLLPVSLFKDTLLANGLKDKPEGHKTQLSTGGENTGRCLNQCGIFYLSPPFF